MIDIYGDMNDIAVELHAVNLGQGAPDPEPPPGLFRAASQAFKSMSRYSTSRGITELQSAVLSSRSCGGADWADAQVTVTAGCTEALAATLLAVTQPGDEVVLIAPYYDAYPAIARTARVHCKTVPMARDSGTCCFHLDSDALRKAITRRTRAILVTSPHNPTGLVLSPAEMTEIVSVVADNGLILIADEVYEHFSYVGEFLSFSRYSMIKDHLVICSSASKSFTVTGWRVGWAIAGTAITKRIREVHQFLSYCAPVPFQVAVASAMAAAVDTDYFSQLRTSYAARRDRLVTALVDYGLSTNVPQSGHFILAGYPGEALCTSTQLAYELARSSGVVGLPLETFVPDPTMVRNIVRFAFCKSDATIDAAIARLSRPGMTS